MDNETESPEQAFLQTLVGMPVCKGFKVADWDDLYDLEFGDPREIINAQGEKWQVGELALHTVCRITIVWKDGTKRVKRYDVNTPHRQFDNDVRLLFGLKVRRIKLSDENDLWIDLGAFWVIFATYEGNEESWRLFAPYQNKPHLIASDTDLAFDE